MPYEPKNFENLIGIAGFSEQLLRNHFTLYQGYVTNTNKLAEALQSLLSTGKLGTPEFAELKRRFGWEFNGMRLHELYFSNMSSSESSINSDSSLSEKIKEDFGSFENWQAEFKAIGTMRGIGWVVLCFDATANRLFNIWINEHDVGHLAGAVPILVMDVFEHAFMLDYGLKRIDYISSFFKSINWQVVEERFAKA